jgi:hypothetical protein
MEWLKDRLLDTLQPWPITPNASPLFKLCYGHCPFRCPLIFFYWPHQCFLLPFNSSHAICSGRSSDWNEGWVCLAFSDSIRWNSTPGRLVSATSCAMTPDDSDEDAVNSARRRLILPGGGPHNLDFLLPNFCCEGLVFVDGASELHNL